MIIRPMNVRRKAIALVALLGLLAACQLPGATDNADGEFITGPGASAVNPSNVDTQKQACERAGGEFRETGRLGLLTCVTTPVDAGKACSASSDCSTHCLARSRSCAPIQPLFGCHDILDAYGRQVTLCID